MIRVQAWQCASLEKRKKKTIRIDRFTLQRYPDTFFYLVITQLAVIVNLASISLFFSSPIKGNESLGARLFS